MTVSSVLSSVPRNFLREVNRTVFLACFVKSFASSMKPSSASSFYASRSVTSLLLLIAWVSRVMCSACMHVADKSSVLRANEPLM